MIYQNNTRTEFFDIYHTELPDSLIFMIIALKSYTSSPGEPDAYSLSSAWDFQVPYRLPGLQIPPPDKRALKILFPGNYKARVTPDSPFPHG